MTTYTFENTRAFRTFFNIADDMPVVTAERVIFDFFLSCGVSTSVWMSVTGWNVSANYPSDGEKLMKIIRQIEG